MSDMMSAYEEVYGLAEKVFLRTLGGDPDAIARRLETVEAEAQTAEGPAFPRFDIPGTTPAEDLHNEIIKDTQNRYFSAMPRETALTICNALGDLGEFTPCATVPALKFNAAALADAWNAANPEKAQIQLNAAAYFSI